MIPPEQANLDAAAELWTKPVPRKTSAPADSGSTSAEDEQAVAGAFAANAAHDDLQQVVTRICLLDDLYRAGVKDPVAWANEICQREDFTDLVQQGDAEAVLYHGKHVYVAATKYCHFANPEAFPMADTLAALAVRQLHLDEDPQPAFLNHQQWWHYRHYRVWREKVDLLRGQHGYVIMDHWLWQLGHFLASKYRPGNWPDEPYRGSGVPRMLWENRELAVGLVPQGLAELLP